MQKYRHKHYEEAKALAEKNGTPLSLWYEPVRAAQWLAQGDHPLVTTLPADMDFPGADRDVNGWIEGYLVVKGDYIVDRKHYTGGTVIHLQSAAEFENNYEKAE